jgi:L-rhamnose mutarotase
MRGIRAAGVVAMEIYRRDDRLVMLMDAAPGFDPAAKAAADALDPDVRAWEKLMEGFQKRLRSAGDGEKWVAAKRIFTLDQQP